MTTRAEIRTVMGGPDVPRTPGPAGAIVWSGCAFVPHGRPVKPGALAAALGPAGAGRAGAGGSSVARGSTNRDANATTSGFGDFGGRMAGFCGCTLLHLRGTTAWPIHMSQRSVSFQSLSSSMMTFLGQSQCFLGRGTRRPRKARYPRPLAVPASGVTRSGLGGLARGRIILIVPFCLPCRVSVEWPRPN